MLATTGACCVGSGGDKHFPMGAGWAHVTGTMWYVAELVVALHNVLHCSLYVELEACWGGGRLPTVF